VISSWIRIPCLRASVAGSHGATRRRPRAASIVLLAIWCCSSGVSVCSASDPDSLLRAIPEDHFVYWRHRVGPNWGTLRGRIEKAADAVQALDLARGLIDGAAARLPEDLREPFRTEANQWRIVLGAIDWSGLLFRECVAGLRFGLVWQDPASLDASVQIDWVAVFRVDPAERAAHLASLRKLLVALAAQVPSSPREDGSGPARRPPRPSFEMEDAEREGVPMTFLKDPTGEPRLCLGGRDDAVVLASSAIQMRRVFQLLAGEGSLRGYREGEEAARIAEGIAGGLPAGGDWELHVRPVAVFERLREMGKEIRGARVRPELSEVKEELLTSLDSLVESLDIVQGIGIAGAVNEARLVAQFRVLLTSEAARRPLGKALLGRSPGDGQGGNVRMVPRDASGFAAVAGWDLPALHDAVLEVVRKALPNGEELFKRYGERSERSGFDLKKDLLSFLRGRSAFIGFPPPAPSRGGDGGAPARPAAGGVGGDWVAMVSLSEAARFDGKLSEWVAKGENTLRVLGTDPAGFEIEGVRGKFRRILLPFPPGMELVFGVSLGDFVAGTSRERIRQAIDARDGKVPSIVESENFKPLDLQPPAEALALAFHDGAELRRVIAAQLRALPLAAVLFGGRAGAGFDPASLLLEAAPKLAPVLDAVLPVERMGGYVERTQDGFRGKAVMTLKPSAAPAGGEKPPEKKRRTF